MLTGREAGGVVPGGPHLAAPDASQEEAQQHHLALPLTPSTGQVNTARLNRLQSNDQSSQCLLFVVLTLNPVFNISRSCELDQHQKNVK